MAIRINRVYTRTGDSGETGLVGGDRVKKTDQRIAAFGTLDELNAWLGTAQVEAAMQPKLAQLPPVLTYLQQELFDLGSQLATPAAKEYDGMWKVNPDHITHLEQLCDRFGNGMPELTSFIIPGGSKVAATLHLARTVCRRAERSIAQLSEDLSAAGQSFDTLQLVYVNRLSDLLFILARWTLKAEGLAEPLWIREVDRKRP